MAGVGSNGREDSRNASESRHESRHNCIAAEEFTRSNFVKAGEILERLKSRRG